MMEIQLHKIMAKERKVFRSIRSMISIGTASHLAQLCFFDAEKRGAMMTAEEDRFVERLESDQPKVFIKP